MMENRALSRENYPSTKLRVFDISRNCSARVCQQLSDHGKNFENIWWSKSI